MTAALQLTDVRKRYGDKWALNGLTFTAPRGAITGLIGPNGAGKTTCFGIVGGLLKADAGSVQVLGQGPFDPRTRRGQLGLLPQDAELPDHARVSVVLAYLARLQGMGRRAAAKEAERVLDLVALSEQRTARLAQLSHGMRRRVAVAQALLGSPPLVLLDEPTSGLDPHLVNHMREVLVQQRAAGVSLVVSSHVLAELEAICDEVVFMEQGRCIHSGDLATVTGRQGSLRVRVELPPPLAELAAELSDLELAYDGKLLHVRGQPGQSVAALSARVLPSLLQRQAGILEVSAGTSLERAYLDRRDGRAAS